MSQCGLMDSSSPKNENSSFTHPHVAPNPFDILPLLKHSHEITLFHTVNALMNEDWGL